MTDRQDRHTMCRAKLDEWRTTVDGIKARAPELDAEDRRKLDEALMRLEHHIAEGEARLSELEDTDDGAWESAKNHWDAAWDMVEKAFEKDSEAYMTDD